MCACVMHMLINLFVFPLINLSLASLIYRAPAGEPKMGKGRDFSSLTKVLSLGVEWCNIDLILAAVWDGARIYWRSIRKVLAVYWRIMMAWSRVVAVETGRVLFFAEYFTSETTREFLLNPARIGNNLAKLTQSIFHSWKTFPNSKTQDCQNTKNIPRKLFLSCPVKCIERQPAVCSFLSLSL